MSVPKFESDADVIDSAAERQTVYLRTFETGPEVELAERLLNEISAARICLLKPEEKAKYDQQLQATLHPVQPPEPPVAETVSQESSVPPLPLQRSVASERPSTRTQSRRRPADKPLWQQPWVMATAGLVERQENNRDKSAPNRIELQLTG